MWSSSLTVLLLTLVLALGASGERRTPLQQFVDAGKEKLAGAVDDAWVRFKDSVVNATDRTAHSANQTQRFTKRLAADMAQFIAYAEKQIDTVISFMAVLLGTFVALGITVTALQLRILSQLAKMTSDTYQSKKEQ